MSVIAKLRVAPENYGLLAIAFPALRPLSRPFPALLAAKRILVICEDDPFTSYPDKEVIQITAKGTFDLDSRSGFLAFLAKSRGVKITKYQQDRLLYELEDNDFWRIAKLASVLKHVSELPAGRIPGRTTILDIFETLFDDFGETYRRYRLSGEPFQVVFSSLLTMMNKTIKVDQIGGIKPYYRRILKKNQSYLTRYRVALLRHSDFMTPSKYDRHPELREKHLLAFLHDCSNPTLSTDAGYSFQLGVLTAQPD